MQNHIPIPYHPYGNGNSLNLDLNGIEEVIIYHGVPENYGFVTYMSKYFSGRSSLWVLDVHINGCFLLQFVLLIHEVEILQLCCKQILRGKSKKSNGIVAMT